MDSTQKAKIRNVLMGLRNFQKPSKYACAKRGANAHRLPEPTKKSKSEGCVHLLCSGPLTALIFGSKWKERRKNNAKFSGHYVRPRTHNVRAHQFMQYSQAAKISSFSLISRLHQHTLNFWILQWACVICAVILNTINLLNIEKVFWPQASRGGQTIFRR